MRPETEAAIRAAGIAQRLADSREGADQVTSKGGIDLVTATDLACEDAIRAELTRAFPAYTVIGEERGGSPAPGAPYWLVDPICGTRPFASHVPLYCTNIALVEHGAVTVAVVGVPIATPPIGLLNETVKFSSPSGRASSTIGMSIVSGPAVPSVKVSAAFCAA